MLYNHNGKYVSSVQLEMNNRSFLYGDGLFERLKLFNGKIFNKENHHKRLSFSLKELKLQLPVSVSELLIQVELLASENRLPSSGVRLSIYRNAGGLYTPNTLKSSYIIETLKDSSDCFQLDTGMRLGVYSKHLKSKGILSTIKSSSANIYVLASLEKKHIDMDELLLLNTERRPIEGTNSNLFIVTKEGMVLTPPLSEGPLSGCMRALIIDNLEVQEQVLNLLDIENAKEVFFTNCNSVRFVKQFGEVNSYENTTSELLVNKLNTLI